MKKNFARIVEVKNKTLLSKVPFVAGNYIIITDGAEQGYLYYDSYVMKSRICLTKNDFGNIDWTGDPTSILVGGLDIGTEVNNMSVADLLYAMTHKIDKPTLTMTLTDNAGPFITNSPRTLSKVVINSSGGYTDAFVGNNFSFSLIVGNKKITNYTQSKLSDTQLVINIASPITIASTTKVTFTVNVEGKFPCTVSSNYTLVNPVYYGSLLNNENVNVKNGISTIIERKDPLSFNYEVVNKYIFAAYDKGWGKLSIIRDKDNQDVTSEFDLKEVDVDGVSYYVYISKNMKTTDGSYNYYFSASQEYEYATDQEVNDMLNNVFNINNNI